MIKTELHSDKIITSYLAHMQKEYCEFETDKEVEVHKHCGTVQHLLLQPSKIAMQFLTHRFKTFKYKRSKN